MPDPTPEQIAAMILPGHSGTAVLFGFFEQRAAVAKLITAYGDARAAAATERAAKVAEREGQYVNHLGIASAIRKEPTDDA